MNDAPAPYVWLAPAEDASYAPAAPSAAEHARVSAWATVRRAKLVRPESATSFTSADAAVASEVEADLARAREALGALDVGALETALARAEQAIRSHPTLLQGAWLRAEVERAWATRWSRVEPRDEARAARAWRRAAALDGGRVPGIGEATLGTPDIAPVTVEFEPRERLEVSIDGKVVAPGKVSLDVGDHHVVARKRGRLVFAQWLDVAHDKPLVLPSLDDPPCTEGDFAAVHAMGDAVSAPDTRCRVWFAVRARAYGRPEAVAQCRAARCGPFVALVDPRVAAVEHATRPNRPVEAERAPAWITWTAIGTGVLLGAGALLYSSGAFDKPARDARFVSGGLKVE